MPLLRPRVPVPPTAHPRAHILPGAALAVLALGAALGCVKPRDITQPVPGAVSHAFPDSAQYVTAALKQAMIDETIDIGLEDAQRGIVESRYEDVGSLRASTSREDYSENERMVRFRFFVQRMLGGTNVVGEAVYRPTGTGGRSMERMVPPEHAAREVLTRIYERVEERLQNERRQREKLREERGNDTTAMERR